MSNMTDGWEIILNSQFHCKEFHIDMVRDFCDIVCNNLLLFGDTVETIEIDKARNTINKLLPYIKAPVHRFRVYLVSGINFFSAAWITDSYEKFSKFIKPVKSEISEYEVISVENVDPNLISTLFVYNGNKLLCAEHIYPSHLAWLLEKLSDVNLIRIEQSL